jgi:hypothetical protein
LNLLLLLPLLRGLVESKHSTGVESPPLTRECMTIQLEGRSAPISLECLFSMTLLSELQGQPDGAGQAGAHPLCRRHHGRAWWILIALYDVASNMCVSLALVTS